MEECGENVDEANLTETTLAENENSYKCSSCTALLCYFGYFSQLTLLK